MGSRKLEPVGTYPILKNVDEKATFEKFGYHSTQLKEKSNKLVVRVCGICGSVKDVYKSAYRDICHKCKMGTDEVVKNLSESHLGIYPSHHIYDDMPIKEIIDQYLSGVGRDELGMIYKCSGDTIRRILVLNNIIIRNGNKGVIRSNDTRDKIRNTLLQYNEDHPEAGERHSAWFQDQDYDQWEGYTDKWRPHLTPYNACIHLNPEFKGCNRHHIMNGVIINMPGSLHRSIRHRFPTDEQCGENMKEINKLAFKYLIRGI